jgi:hypothetical protein
VKGHFSKDDFGIDLDSQTVTCPAGITTTIRALEHQLHAGIAEFGVACASCPLAARCTTAKAGRTITIGRYEAWLAAGRARQSDPVWKADYRATRPKVERKIGHLDAAASWWASRSGSWAGEGGRGFLVVGRCGQPCSVGQARGGIPAGWVGSDHRLNELVVIVYGCQALSMAGMPGIRTRPRCR